MAPKKLHAIAEQMIAAVENAPQARAWVSNVLPRGLEIIYSKDHDIRRVALRRTDVTPGPEEVRIVSEVFGVPASTEPNGYQRKLPNPISGRDIRYHVIELVWREIGQPYQPSFLPAADAYSAGL